MFAQYICNNYNLNVKSYISLGYGCSYIFLCISVGYTGAYRHLVPQQPQSSLIELSNLVSIVGQVILVLLFQLGAFFLLQSQEW